MPCPLHSRPRRTSGTIHRLEPRPFLLRCLPYSTIQEVPCHKHRRLRRTCSTTHKLEPRPFPRQGLPHSTLQEASCPVHTRPRRTSGTTQRLASRPFPRRCHTHSTGQEVPCPVHFRPRWISGTTQRLASRPFPRQGLPHSTLQDVPCSFHLQTLRPGEGAQSPSGDTQSPWPYLFLDHVCLECSSRQCLPVRRGCPAVPGPCSPQGQSPCCKCRIFLSSSIPPVVTNDCLVCWCRCGGLELRSGGGGGDWSLRVRLEGTEGNNNSQHGSNSYS